MTAGYAVSAYGEIMRAFRNMWLVRHRKISTREYLRREPSYVLWGVSLKQESAYGAARTATDRNPLPFPLMLDI